MHPKIVEDDHRPPTAKELLSVSSISSSESVDDFFQVNATEFKSRAATTAPPKHDDKPQPARKDSEIDVSSNNSFFKLDDPDNGSIGPASSQVSDLTHESVLPSMSPTQSPPVQVMERSGDYDPARIPSSIFASKPSTPLEWSVASNESLFSIQVGNNSFSRDHIFMLGGDLRKSGELTKSGELILFSPPPPVTVVETDGMSADKGKNFGAARVADESIWDFTKGKTHHQSEENITPLATPRNPSSTSHRSDGSGGSTQSFAFPVKKKCKRPFGNCSNCSCTLCYCTWPSCYCSNCNWASCYCWNCSRAFCYGWNCSRKGSCCSWVFCCRWNCNRKGSCCVSSTTFTDGMKNNSVKVDAERHKHKIPQTPAPEMTKKVASKGCCSCSCSSWWPRCSCCC